MLALQALIHHARGEESAALAKLSQALDLAEPGGFIRLFVDLGPQMADLLKLLIEKNLAVKNAGRILSAFRKEARHPISPPAPGSFPGEMGPPASQPLVEPPTKRELEILELLAQRLRNKEIAAKLFVSPVTIKKHLTSIYGKLNVNGRLQAIEKADALGILTRR